MNENVIPVFILNELVILPNQDIKIDLINESTKKVIKESSKKYSDNILVIAPKNPLESSPSIDDFPNVGVIAKIKSKIELSDNKMRIVIRGKKRVNIDKYYQNKKTGVVKCSYSEVDLPEFDQIKETAVKRKLISLTEEYIDSDNSISNSIKVKLNENTDISQLTDIITSFMPLPFNKKIEYMETINPITRANNLINDLFAEININNIDKELDEKLQENLENSQREFILKEKLKEINNELGNDKDEEIERLNELVNNLDISKTSKNKLLNEIKKYASSSEYSPETALLKNYIDTLINLPWHKKTKENKDPKKIMNLLNSSHYGLDEVKERICEYVALKNNSKDLSSPIICLVGPPGVGKTSIAMSIAKSLNREFYKMSVGGLNDSTELVGSRKTYLGASPGKIMQAIIKCDAKNPLILIDEVDKMVRDYKGDPAATLLEILDETQNKYFVDNYIEEPFDLSEVLFVLTANEIDEIPLTLLDRLEIISINSYTLEEKIDIAKNYLIKNILKDYNINIKIANDTIEYLVNNYTKEPGVRELKKLLEKLIRKVCVYEQNSKSITTTHIKKYLGKEISSFVPDIKDYGIVNTVAYSVYGGQISHVEVSKHKGSGKINITGNLGKVLTESVQVVCSYLASEYGIDLNQNDIHIHFINGAQKKDGPSAGLSIATAILSLFKKKIIKKDIAFTGELSLKGSVMPVGAIKEKVTACATSGIKKIYIPKENEEDIKDISKTILNKIEIKLISNYNEVYKEIFK